MLDIEKLVTLRAVAAHGSFAAAAREMGYTRSAVSQHVTALERAAGSPLLVRSGKRVTLTPVGSQLLEHTERILIELRAAEATLRQNVGEVAGRLRIGVPFREGPGVMRTALTRVRQRFPKLEITLTATSNVTGAEDVRHGRLDMVILSLYGVAPAPCEPGLRQWVLGHDVLQLCVPAGHRLSEQASCSVADLRDERWVMSPSTPLGRLSMALFATAGFQPSISASVDDVGTALGLVSVGWGVTIAPELTPIAADANITRIGITGLDAFRHSVLLVRDGEQDAPQIAPVVSAVHVASSNFAYMA